MDHEEEDRLAEVFSNTSDPMLPLDIRCGIDGTPYFLWFLSNAEETIKVCPSLTASLKKVIDFSNPNFDEVRIELTTFLINLAKKTKDRPKENSDKIYLGKTGQKQKKAEIETAELIGA